MWAGAPFFIFDINADINGGDFQKMRENALSDPAPPLYGSLRSGCLVYRSPHTWPGIYRESGISAVN